MKFNNLGCSSNGLLQYISKLGDSIIGCELGVWAAENLCQILESCPNIIKMYAIDPYLPYQDWDMYMDETVINSVKRKAVHNLNSIQQSSKVEFLEMLSSEACHKIEDDSLDFIFIDGDHSYERAYEDFCNYYSKVKSCGMFAGHDYSLTGVNQALRQFLPEKGYGFEQLTLISNDAWFIYKK
jgi:hypothetical protein